MIYTKNSDWSIQSISWSQYITLSTYDKATITYPVNKVVYKTTTEKKQNTVIDADGKEHILRTYEVEVPVMEKKLVKEKISKINPDTNEEIFEEIEKEVEEPVISDVIREIVRYNPYDAQWVIIIPDDAKILTEEEYNEFLQSFQK